MADIREELEAHLRLCYDRLDGARDWLYDFNLPALHGAIEAFYENTLDEHDRHWREQSRATKEALLEQDIENHNHRDNGYTADQFVTDYCRRSGITPEQLLARRVVVPCDCDYTECSGWGVVPKGSGTTPDGQPT